MPVMNILPRTQFFLKSTEVLGGKYAGHLVATNLPVADAREVMVILRVHEIIGSNIAGAKAEVQMFNSAPTQEDPGKTFRGAQLGTTGTFTYVANPLNVPGIAVTSAASGVGEALDVPGAGVPGNRPHRHQLLSER